MQPNEHLRKLIKIFIFAFLCTEMQTTFTGREQTQQRSIGGYFKKTTRANELASTAPYQASIRLIEAERDYFGKGHICSGALVAPSVVLTVGRCVYNYENRKAYHPAELRVMLGSTLRFAPTVHTSLFGVTHIYRTSDIAVLMLERDVTIVKGIVQPLQLPEASMPEPWHSYTYNISTWGVNSEGNELHELVTYTAKTINCDDKQADQVTICLVKNSDMIRSQDVGAPLLKENCLLGLRREEDSFVDVALYVDWIEEQIGDGSNQNSAIWGILGFLAFTAHVLNCSCKNRLY
ncbi:hyaluronan-binding protein 2 [Scaptodrosophila lebanonensis]|uniref:Hyaluronan-binding protein 2 n=1 Tax=Drosophila lebanonensis TaxID=7225 RepID=A0A6J2U0L3_DROLE|nr:hyaluronan-binding protein 2 [Scaptodrosophila lebanonensis]